MTLNNMRAKRWQIVSDDHVWMYPADVSLSTVQLPGDFYKDSPYETCVFFANGDSEVLERYSTQAEAINGHIKYEEKYKLKRISKSEFKI